MLACPHASGFVLYPDSNGVLRLAVPTAPSECVVLTPLDYDLLNNRNRSGHSELATGCVLSPQSINVERRPYGLIANRKVTLEGIQLKICGCSESPGVDSFGDPMRPLM